MIRFRFGVKEFDESLGGLVLVNRVFAWLFSLFAIRSSLSQRDFMFCSKFN